MKNMIISILLVFLNLLFFDAVVAQTTIINGPVSGNWTLTGSPYLIDGDIEILDDSTLTIDPGVSVIFQGHYALNVQGVLLALGAENDSILFTINDTTGFHNPNINNGGWEGIRIIDPDTTNDSTKIVYCKLEYAKAVGSVWHINAGGALTILNFDKVLISNSLFAYNSAGGDSTDVPSGGAIHLAWSDVLIKDNTFKHNRAVAGGAIQFHDSHPTFIANTFINNRAAKVSGAIDIGGKSSATFTNDQILENTSLQNGGGIVCWDSTVTIMNNVIISGNTSNDGGGIYTTSANLTLNNCIITQNGARSIGGGINCFNSNITIHSTKLENDTASVFGGGAGFYESEVNIDSCEFNSNSSRVLGGGIHSDFSDITLTNSTFSNDTSESGGAIFAWYNHLAIDNCIFSNNSAKYNSGAIHSESGATEIIGCSFTQNRAIWGGAVGLYKDTARISNSIFLENISEHGGGINTGMSQLNMFNVAFEQNRSIWGGGISLGNSEAEIDSCSFLQNIANNNAGGIEYFADTLIQALPYKLRLLNTIFEENSALFRGALEIQQNNTEESIVNVEIDNCQFLNNSATTAVNILISGKITDFMLSNSIISGNKSILRTSGCNFSNYVSGTVTNCLFKGNYTGGGGSAASVGIGANISFINCTIANNKGTNGAAITLRNSGKVLLLNSILWSNEPYNVILNAVSDPVGCKLDLYYSNIQNGFDSILVNDSISVVNWGRGNLNLDPLFVDTLNADFQLQNLSSCIGGGSKSLEINGELVFSPDYDILGNPSPSPSGSNPDIGAYENSYGTPTEVKEVTDKIPDRFKLFQNYPNPFNPTTTINYQIPSSVISNPNEMSGKKSYASSKISPSGRNDNVNVQLKIYDILGREVATLVNENQKPGNYEVEFDRHSGSVRNLTSGIYFYQLKSEQFVQTKKMIIIK